MDIRIIVPAVLIVAVLWAVNAQTEIHTIQINLTLNDSDFVFTPGLGIDTPATLPDAVYTTPPDFYLASYGEDILYGIVHSQRTPLSIATRSDATYHYLSTNQNLSSSQVFVVFSTGDYQAIANRMNVIREEEFLTASTPSFSYGLGGDNAIHLVLEYDDIDILNSYIFRQGVHEFVIESNSTGGLKQVIFNETV